MFEDVADKIAGTRFCCGLRFTSMELETLYDLYLHELRDLYSAEQQLIKAAPEIEQRGDEPPTLGRI
jgi:cytochrome P450